MECGKEKDSFRSSLSLSLSLSFTGRDGEDVITEGNDSSNNCLNSHHWTKLAIHSDSSCTFLYVYRILETKNFSDQK